MFKASIYYIFMNSDIYITEIERLRELSLSGTVSGISGLLIECAGLNQMLRVGARVRIYGWRGSLTENGVLAEVVGFRQSSAL